MCICPNPSRPCTAPLRWKGPATHDTTAVAAGAEVAAAGQQAAARGEPCGGGRPERSCTGREGGGQHRPQADGEALPQPRGGSGRSAAFWFWASSEHSLLALVADQQADAEPRSS